MTTAQPAALSVAPVPACQESRWAPSITTSPRRSVPGISASVFVGHEVGVVEAARARPPRARRRVPRSTSRTQAVVVLGGHDQRGDARCSRPPRASRRPPRAPRSPRACSAPPWPAPSPRRGTRGAPSRSARAAGRSRGRAAGPCGACRRPGRIARARSSSASVYRLKSGWSGSLGVRASSSRSTLPGELALGLLEVASVSSFELDHLAAHRAVGAGRPGLGQRDQAAAPGGRTMCTEARSNVQPRPKGPHFSRWASWQAPGCELPARPLVGFAELRASR